MLIVLSFGEIYHLFLNEIRWEEVETHNIPFLCMHLVCVGGCECVSLYMCMCMYMLPHMCTGCDYAGLHVCVQVCRCGG